LKYDGSTTRKIRETIKQGKNGNQYEHPKRVKSIGKMDFVKAHFSVEDYIPAYFEIIETIIF